MNGPSPGAQGYRFPAEWAPHRATWLSWIHKEASWPGKLEAAYKPYVEFIKHLAEKEEVCINLNSDEMEEDARRRLLEARVRMDRVKFYRHITNDAWCRDHGPAFLLHGAAQPVNASQPSGERTGESSPLPSREEMISSANGLPRKIIIDWAYNAWGGKYPPFEEDDQIPTQIAAALGMPVFYPGVVMEGGSVEFNGAGTLLTTKACLLNENRNPHLNQSQIEQFLAEYYGVEQILWLEDGIEGDDTDGHIDDLTRFVNAETVVTVLEDNRLDNNYDVLKKNLDDLKKMRLLNGQKLEIVTLPMPGLVEYDEQRLPASYANFYIANGLVIVPTFEHKNDDKALRILEDCFPGRSIVGISSVDLIWGLGAFHCLSQQEPV